MDSVKHPIKVLVFIARDHNEYEKYLLEKASMEQYDWNRDGISSKNNRYQWRFSLKMRILRLVIEKGVLGEDSGWKYLRPPKEGDERLLDDEARLADILEKLRRNPNADQNVKELCKLRCWGLFCNKTKTRGKLRNILAGLKDEDKNSILEIADVQCRIFIHWGGGEREQVLYYERMVSRLLPNDLPNDWRLYSLGTNRNELFSVDRPKIIIPSKAEDLEELDRRFSEEQRSAGVISDVPLAIVASASGEIKNENQIKAVVSRLKELRDRVLLSNLEPKRKNELLEEFAAALKDFEGKSCVAVINEKTMKLARQILNDEVFND